MQATLNVTTKILAFADATESSNPRLKMADWLRDLSGISVSDPRSEGFRILPGDSLTVFSGLRATTLDGTSTFALSLLPVDEASRYRIAWTGGTNPTFRTGRALAPNGMTFIFAVQPNATVNVNASAVLFGSVVPGDMVFIPHTTTGDAANVISVINAGYWQVLSVTDPQNLTLVRPAGEDFEGVSETVVLTADTQFQAFSQAGVQLGDSVDISAGFALAAQRVFEVVGVTDKFVEIISTSPLPSQVGVQPSQAGMVFYTDIKGFLYLESTQEVVVRVNGDVGNYQRVVPVDSSDPTRPGIYMRHGPTWSLVVYNKSSQAANVTVIHAE